MVVEIKQWMFVFIAFSILCVGIISLFVCYLLLAYYSTRHNTSGNAKRRKGLSKDELRELPTFIIGLSTAVRHGGFNPNFQDGSSQNAKSLEGSSQNPKSQDGFSQNSNLQHGFSENQNPRLLQCSSKNSNIQHGSSSNAKPLEGSSPDAKSLDGSSGNPNLQDSFCGNSNMATSSSTWASGSDFSTIIDIDIDIDIDIECPVCLENLTIGDECLRIPACNHYFHLTCADAWLSQNSICPICRAYALSSSSGSSRQGTNKSVPQRQSTDSMIELVAARS